MNTGIVKDIIEFTLQNVDFTDENCMNCIKDLLGGKINTVIYDVGVVAVVQCNDQNNTEEMASNGELIVDVLLIDTADLTTDKIRAHAVTDLGVVTVSFEEQW